MQLHTLPPELYWLTLTTLMTALFWVPYILNWMVEQGVVKAVWDPDDYDHSRPRAAWAVRMFQAHQNAVENLVIFAPLVLTLHALGISTDITVTACAVYFWARAAHFLVFTFAVPLLRVLTFATAFGAQMVLGLVLLGVM
jgi:uncharacterized MAPEG superfamily protein